MKITVNGNELESEPEWTLGNLADHFDLDPRAIIVECNGEALHRSEWPLRPIQPGDKIEFLRVAAGG